MDIKSIGLNSTLLNTNNLQTSMKKNISDFSSILENALNKVNQLQIESDNYKMLLSIGEVDNLHDVTIAAEKANIALQLTLSVRNKVVEAYQEIMRMQI
jgi:flagellar hook-basal body complex protein FliE